MYTCYEIKRNKNKKNPSSIRILLNALTVSRHNSLVLVESTPRARNQRKDFPKSEKQVDTLSGSALEQFITFNTMCSKGDKPQETRACFY